MGFSRHEYWSGLPFPPPENLHDTKTEPHLLCSPALAGRILYHWATWEALNTLSVPNIKQKLLSTILFNGEGKGNPLQYSCLENPVDGGAWWAAVHSGRTELDTTEAT